MLSSSKKYSLDLLRTCFEGHEMFRETNFVKNRFFGRATVAKASCWSDGEGEIGEEGDGRGQEKRRENNSAFEVWFILYAFSSFDAHQAIKSPNILRTLIS